MKEAKHTEMVYGEPGTLSCTQRGQLQEAESSIPRQWSMLNLQIRLVLGSYLFVAELGSKSAGVPTVMVYHGCQLSGI